MKSLPLIFTFLCFNLCSFSQEKPMYSSPEASEYQPVVLSVNDAIANAERASGSCAYTQTFVSSEDLTRLLSISKCVGVRFYNGFMTEQDKNASMIAVAVDETGKEIGKVFSNNYLCVASLDQSARCESQSLSKSKARVCVENVVNADLSSQKVFFSKALLEERMRAKNATGVSILPAINDRDESTMSVSGASFANGKITVVESEYYQSELPCPTDCGNTDDYLVAPK